MTLFDRCFQERIYLPCVDSTKNNDISQTELLKSYIELEFPQIKNGKSLVYSVPNIFHKTGERQANLAEETVFDKLQGLHDNPDLDNLWVTFFHSASYAGHSYRNHRVGKLMIREHDFVVFAKHKDQFYVALLEVKSTNDNSTRNESLEKTSDSKLIKNNKRSAQHQLRDHMEVLQKMLGVDNQIQCYIMWPFLGAYTKSPNQEVIRRWKEDRNLHAFQDCFAEQNHFDQWFVNNILNGDVIEENHFYTLLNRYIILSCGIFIDEIYKGMLALLTQEQLHLMNKCNNDKFGGPFIVHGAAGSGKTMLVLKKLQQLHSLGQLDQNNRALYICYWPGIRCDIEMKLEQLGILQFVDTARFYVSLPDFLKNSNTTYKHVFMDEAEALCLAFTKEVIQSTYSTIFRLYHNGNCSIGDDCINNCIDDTFDMTKPIKAHNSRNWGQLWFMVDINQAALFLPKHSPQMLKTPSVSLNKIMRSSKNIYTFFRQFYIMPIPRLASIMSIPNICCGHNINGPPIYWVEAKAPIAKLVGQVIIDLCSTKGIKPNSICIIPFLVNEQLVPEAINQYVDSVFVENTFRPKAIGDVELYIRKQEYSDFLMSWALRVKGLEFKVVIMVVEDDDFDPNDGEDRRKIYIMSSRCTCLLILISNQSVRKSMNLNEASSIYPFDLKFDIDTE